MAEALRCMGAYLLALLVTLLVGGSWLLDGPSETDALQATALDLVDAVAQAALKDRP